MKNAKKKHIVIAVPAYDGMLHVGTHRSILHDVVSLMNRGDTVQVEHEVGNADISNCRAMIVAKFLAIPGATHLVMVDSDVCWEAGSVAKLVDARVDFVAGAYPQRQGEDIKYHLHMMPREVQEMDKETGLFEVHAVPAGFMCLSRSMLERMVQHYAAMKFAFKQTPQGYAWDLFDGFWTTDADGMRHKLGEDYSFCYRWRDMGGRIFVDPTISMGHLGTKMWAGRLSDSFKVPGEAKAA